MTEVSKKQIPQSPEEFEVGRIYGKIKFGKTLALSSIIKSLDIEQKEFAKISGYTEVYISQIASQSIKISDKAVTKICLAAGKDVTTELIRSALYIKFGDKVFGSDGKTSGSVVSYLIEEFIAKLDGIYEITETKNKL